MARSRVILGTQYFPDPRAGRPLANGTVYIGQIDLDPTILANRKTVYLIQEDGTEIPIAAASQPLNLSAGGVVSYLGSPVQVETDDAYSIAVLDNLGVQVYYFNSVVDSLENLIELLQPDNFYTNDPSSSSNAYVIIPPASVSPAPDAIVDGQLITFRPSDDNSGPSTINVVGDGGPIGSFPWVLPDGTNDLPSGYVRTTRDYKVRWDGANQVFIDIDMGMFSNNPGIPIWNQYVDYNTVPSYVTGSDGNLYKSTTTSGPNLGGDVDPVGDTSGTWILVPSAVDPVVMDFRLTLATGDPVPTSNITNATTVYLCPYIGNRISLYNGSAWVTIESAEVSLALGIMTDEMVYDIFAYLNAGALAIEKLSWSTSTARATALTKQDGIYVKSGDATRRYIGSFFTNSTTQTGDNASCQLTLNTGRFLWNYYNRVPRNLYNSFTVGSHAYTTATWRKFNNDDNEVITFVVGVVEDSAEFSMVCASSNSGAGNARAIGIGNNSSTVPEPITCGIGGAAGSAGGMFVSAKFLPQLGRNDVYGLQYAEAAGTATWYSSFVLNQAGGLIGTVLM